MRKTDEIGADIQHDINNGYFAHEKICALYEAVTDGIPLDRLEEICQAERDGRCVVLPCRVGELKEMLSDLESVGCGDGAETYTTGYRNGYRNGRIELLRYILNIPDGTQEAEAALERSKT